MKNIAIISTDWHIDSENVELSKKLAVQQIQLAQKKNVDWLICLGDIFDAKKAQPELVLLAFKSILDMVQQAGMKLWAIAGNHDKVNPYEWDSYLEPFVNHPAFHLIAERELVDTEKQLLYFQSYIKEPLWIEKISGFVNNIKKSNKPVYLFSHQAMNGSKNNDGTKVESSINQQLLLPFEKCFFGHYHDSQQPLPNAYHLGAWKQKNFGENTEKGFYVLQEDDKGFLDVEFCKSKYPEYITMDVDAKSLDEETLSHIFSKKNLSDSINLRLRITGSTDELKAIPIARLSDAGIKIKTIDTLEKTIGEVEQKIQNYEKAETLLEAFKDFCAERGFDYNEGLNYLKSIL